VRTYVCQTVSRCFAALRQLRSIRHLVSATVFQSLVAALVLCRLDYVTSSMVRWLWLVSLQPLGELTTLPQTPSRLGRGIPPPHSPPHSTPSASQTRRLVLRPPQHKILATPVSCSTSRSPCRLTGRCMEMHRSLQEIL